MSRTKASLLLTLLTTAACRSLPPGAECSLNITASPPTVDITEGAYTSVCVDGAAGGVAPVLSTDYGSFEKPAQPGDSADDVREVANGTVTGGRLCARLYADQIAPADGVAHVKARLIDCSGTQCERTAAVNIEFRPPAAAESLSFSCTTYNIGALADLTTETEIPCHAIAKDGAGQPILSAPIRYLAEAGKMKYEGDQLVYAPHDPASIRVGPVDVDPIGAEPYRTSPDGNVHNPRDSLVTIIAWVPASKELAVDREALGEPFVDANDNGQRDENEDYFDLNGNGQWDALQDDSVQTPHALWRQVKILWSGMIDTQPPVLAIDPTYADLGYLTSQTFVVTLLDRNFNVVASNDPANDGISCSFGPIPDVSAAPGQAPMEPFNSTDDSRRFGMLLDDDFNFIHPEDQFSWELGGTYACTVQNTMACNTPLVPETFSLQLQTTRTLFLDAMGNPVDVVHDNLDIGGGTLEPPPTSVCMP